MAQRQPNHSFNKQQKERKREAKAARKNERRALAKQKAPEQADPESDGTLEDSPVDTATVGAGSRIEPEPKPNDSE